LLSLLQAANTMSFAALATVALGVLVLYVIKALFTRKRPAGPLPPGPRPKPVLGNISDLPPPGAQDWVHWMKHNDLYGTHANAWSCAFLTSIRRLRADQLNNGDGTAHCDRK
jgi:predicted alpha/beta hydrolase